MSEEFMERMRISYPRVHNERYWDEITSVIPKEELKSKTIMDLGCGPGLLLKDLVSIYNPDKIIGIDLSKIMLNQAKIELEPIADNVDINLVQQHLQDTPVLPDKADAIFTSRVLRSFEDQKVTMNSIHQALNPGGFLVILDWMKADISTYENWFKYGGNEFSNLTPAEVISYHRNFSRYNLEDWRYILLNFNFRIRHAFQLDAVHGVIIATV